MATNDLENDAFVKRMLTGLSARTKENYLRRLPMWNAFIQMSLTQQIEKRLKDLASQDLIERTFFENKFRACKEFFEKFADDSAKNLGFVCGFFQRLRSASSSSRGSPPSLSTLLSSVRHRLYKLVFWLSGH